MRTGVQCIIYKSKHFLFSPVIVWKALTSIGGFGGVADLFIARLAIKNQTSLAGDPGRRSDVRNKL